MIDTKRLDVISQHQLLTWRREGRYEHSDSGIFSSFDRSPHAHSSTPPRTTGYQGPHDLHEQRSLHRKQLYEKLACFFESRNNRTYRKCFCDFSILFGEPIERLSDGFHSLQGGGVPSEQSISSDELPDELVDESSVSSS